MLKELALGGICNLCVGNQYIQLYTIYYGKLKITKKFINKYK